MFIVLGFIDVVFAASRFWAQRDLIFIHHPELGSFPLFAMFPVVSSRHNCSKDQEQQNRHAEIIHAGQFHISASAGILKMR